MLTNRKYVGVWPWGTTRILRSSEGKVRQVAVPADKQIVRSRPELRIIDQDLWERAQKRLDELKDLYGQKPGQKRRGPMPHHTAIYPKSLLGGLIHCHTCGSPLWSQAAGNRAYFGCPNHQKGICSVAGRVPVAKAETALLKFVSHVLMAWPGWLEAAAAAMRRAITDAGDRVPEVLRADEVRLAELQKQINNLLDHMAAGPMESPAIRNRLVQLEREESALKDRIADGRQAREAALAMPDDTWIRAQLAGLPSLLADDPQRGASLLRRLLGRVTAEAILAPGKSRGFIRLHVCVNGLRVIEEVLGGRLPEAVLAFAAATTNAVAPEFQLDLGEPTRHDSLAPLIAALRAQGVTWTEIGRVTGLGTGNSYNVWKRWVDAQLGDSSARA